MEKIIDLRNITVSYGDNVILDKLNLYINEKEFITLRLRQDHNAALYCRLCAAGQWGSGL